MKKSHTAKAVADQLFVEIPDEDLDAVAGGELLDDLLNNVTSSL